MCDRMLAYELEGVVIDTENTGFDAVCLQTVKYVRDAIYTAPKAECAPRIAELEHALVDTRENSRMWAQRCHDLEQAKLRVSDDVRDGEAFRYMIEVAKVAGFASITEAIATARRLREANHVQLVAIYQTSWSDSGSIWGDVPKEAYDIYRDFGYKRARIVYAARDAEH